MLPLGISVFAINKVVTDLPHPAPTGAAGGMPVPRVALRLPAVINMAHLRSVKPQQTKPAALHYAIGVKRRAVMLSLSKHGTGEKRTDWLRRTSSASQSLPRAKSKEVGMMGAMQTDSSATLRFGRNDEG
ncbi:MAG: hypothetical protein LBK47_09015 [Prevotellaceae bacterium]|jgi:hypothetical protein|nr:hypothetical protein [Prevotellaceae bacterium]